jgi:hypothetical protein
MGMNGADAQQIWLEVLYFNLLLFAHFFGLLLLKPEVNGRLNLSFF